MAAGVGQIQGLRLIENTAGMATRAIGFDDKPQSRVIERGGPARLVIELETSP